MSLTVKRNSKIVGHNSKSYDEKHPTNPVSLRPIHDAIKETPRVRNSKGEFLPDFKRIRELLSYHVLPKPLISYLVNYKPSF